MNIIVCLKQVPGTTEVKINPQTNTLIRQGIKNVINPFDTYALEAGVRLKEKLGGKVTALSMGPPQAAEMLKEAISLGADDAILLSDAAFAGSDTWATAFTLAAAVKKLGQTDLILCGRQSTDGDTAQVGPELAEILNIPFIAYVGIVEEIDASRMRVKRMIEEGYEVMQSPLPAVITVTKEINVPRLPSLRGLMKSKSAKITVWTASELGLDPSNVGLNGSFTKVVKIFTPQRTKKAQMIGGEPAVQAECLAVRLKEGHLI
ncbi:MAG TPA: electron transfer flavoprotein subunit beta/FixA family protein [Dehalococcoidales bacterium]|nr:electron transfer flavoprotein subunit beta/FixA family protein [Dehalococcoidales bacterium]